jgi:hypothetical protein
MAQFGQTSPGASSFSIGLNPVACRYQNTAGSGSADNLIAYLIKNFGGTSGCIAAVYDDSAGVPGALRFTAGNVNITSTVQNFTFGALASVIATTYANNDYYWIAVWPDTANAGSVDFYYISGATGQFSVATDLPTYPTFSDPWDPSASTFDVEATFFTNFTLTPGGNSTNFFQFF